jgi:regulator of protease activity HflC (stomatin/prohibitin superfamily)
VVPLIIGAIVALVVILVLARTVRIIPQARAGVVERLGRYHRTLRPGVAILIPFVDRLSPLLDLREQVVSFPPQPVITEDNLVVSIDSVIYFQITDPKAATYEIASYLMGIEQLTVTTLRNVIGSLDLEDTLTSRDEINGRLRGVLDEATGKWGIRVNRVELKAIDPPASVQESMEKQMRAERDKRAAILTAEGQKASVILQAEGYRQSQILQAEGEAQAVVTKAEGEAEAIATVFGAIHDGDADPKLLAYQYLQALPEIARGAGSTMWFIPSELTTAMSALGDAFGATRGADPNLADAFASRPREAAPRREREPWKDYETNAPSKAEPADTGARPVPGVDVPVDVAPVDLPPVDVPPVVTPPSAPQAAPPPFEAPEPPVTPPPPFNPPAP